MTEQTADESSSTLDSTRLTRVIALVLPGLLPWAVVTYRGGYYLVFAFGSTNVGLRGFNLLSGLRFGNSLTTGYFNALTAAIVLYALALLSAALSRVDLEDERVTLGLLVLTAIAVLRYAVGVSGQHHILTVPIATVTLSTAATYEYYRTPGRLVPRS